jgi:hypothetical protein
MDTKWIKTLVLVAVTSMTSVIWAQTPPAGKASDKPAATQADAATIAPLRAELHRTIAALIEAQAASPPDQAKVQELTTKVQELRTKLAAVAPGTDVRGPMAGGRGWGGPGVGPGMGRGPGRGWGPGYGPGPGYGRGQGYGRGAGGGWGPGAGYGPGRGFGFVDANRNGVCDNYERIWGQR